MYDNRIIQIDPIIALINVELTLIILGEGGGQNEPYDDGTLTGIRSLLAPIMIRARKTNPEPFR